MNETEATTEVTGVAYNQPREWLWWTVATAGGWLAAYWIGALLNGLVLSLLQLSPAALSGAEPLPESAQLPLLVLQLATLFVIGVTIGGAQWLILRRHVSEVSRWPLFTALGCMITSFAGPFWFMVIGLGMGLPQWLILRRTLNRTGWWPLISVVAWILGNILGNAIGILLATVLGAVLVQMISITIMGIVSGVLTGVVLLWLLRVNHTLLAGLREEAEQAK